SRASRRKTLWTSWASSHRAVALPALVIRPSRRSFSPLFRQPGVSPQELARPWARGNRSTRPTRQARDRAVNPRPTPARGDGAPPGVLVDAEVQHGRLSGKGVGHRTLPGRRNPVRLDAGRACIDINARNTSGLLDTDG